VVGGRRRDLALFEGPRIVQELFRYHAQSPNFGSVHSVFFDESLGKEDRDSLARMAPAGTPVAISRTGLRGDAKSCQGVLALAEIPHRKDEKSAGAVGFLRSTVPLGGAAILSLLTDPSNLGALVRVAEACGVSSIVQHGGCWPLAPRAVRASAGSILRVPVFHSTESKDPLGLLAEGELGGWDVYAASPRGQGPRQVSWVDWQAAESRRTILIIGAEAEGLGPRFASHSAITHHVTAPMMGHVESLNAVTSAAILLHPRVKDQHGMIF
jgi:TrmH family RNA methyltransferase